MTSEYQDVTFYSVRIEGDKRNHQFPVQFDATDGYIGIEQFDGESRVQDRVLLTPKQAEALVKFIMEHAD